jgi:lysophospholipase
MAVNTSHPNADIGAEISVNARTIATGAVEDMVTASDGWPLRRICWAAPAASIRGNMLFLGGRADHYEKYVEAFADWRDRGWQVESVDWRGQGGSGRLSDNPRVGHVERYALWIDDLADYVAAWRARTAGPHVIIAHSMGGHLVLRALMEQRIAADAVVLVAPMQGFTAPYPNWLGHIIARAMCAIGNPARAAWKVSEKPGTPLKLRQLLLTHDDGRYSDEGWWHQQRPELPLGPASWRWVEQGYASFIAKDVPGALEAVSVPILALATSADKLVSTPAIVRDIGRIASASIHVYGREAAHELLREADGVRDDVLRRIDDFLTGVIRA